MCTAEERLTSVVSFPANAEKIIVNLRVPAKKLTLFLAACVAAFAVLKHKLGCPL